MKIVMVNKFLTRHAGAEKYFFDVSELLRAHGHEVVMWGMEQNPVVSSQYSVDSKEKILKNYNLQPTTYNLSYIDFENPKTLINRLKCFFRMMYSFEAKKKFKALIEEFKPDIVHIHNIYHQISPSFLDVCRSKKIPVVMSVHDYNLICPNYKLFSHGRIDEGCKKNYFHDAFTRSTKNSFLGSIACAFELWFHHKILKIYEKSISAYLCPSEFVKNKLIEFGFPKGKVLLQRYFLQTHDHTLRVLNSELGINNKIMKHETHNMKQEEKHQNINNVSSFKFQVSRYILSYGRLSEEKGFEVLIRTMKGVSEDVILKITGSGPDEERLKKITKELYLEDRIEFLGWKTGDEFQKLRKNAACIVVPSIWHDPSPFAVLENLAEGNLVIGSRVGGITEILGAVGSELLYDAYDGDMLQKKISGVLTFSDTQRNEISLRAKEYIAKEYNPLDHHALLVDIYNTSMSVLR